MRWWVVVAGAGAVLGALALLSSGSSRAPSAQEDRRAIGAYRPERLDGERRARGVARGEAGTAGVAEGTERELSPELEQRLRAAAHISTVPAPRPAGTSPPLPPSGPLPPEVEAQRQQALIGWKIQAQQQLDDCVARPAAQRQPVMLNVIFAPAPAPAGLAVQQLSPVAVSIPPHELRRLWRDTDPDMLQGCIDRMRTLSLPVPVAPRAAAQVMPSSMETMQVQL